MEDLLKCPLCHQLFRQAVLAPCCGSTYCSDCAIDRLAHSIESSCPGCGKEVLVHQLIANEDIRKQVDQVTRASKAAALAAQKESSSPDMQEPQQPQSLSFTAALKDRVNRPRKHAEERVSDSAPPLALTDGRALRSLQRFICKGVGWKAPSLPLASLHIGSRWPLGHF
eukprot:g1612.t1